MGFLNPTLLWFGLGAAIPVIIHLLHRQRYRRVRWGAMQFLLKAIKRTQRRVRLEHIILLIVRMIIMTLLALALARPSLESTLLHGSSDVNYIFAIDNSYSMGYKKGADDALKQAKQRVKKLIEQTSMSMEDTITIIRMNEYPDDDPGIQKDLKKSSFTNEVIDGIELSDYGSSAYRVFLRIKQEMEKTRNKYKKIYVLTDMQKNSWIPSTGEEKDKLRELLKQLSTDKDTKIYILNVGGDETKNVAIVKFKSNQPTITTKSEANFTAEVFNFSEEAATNLDLTIYVREPEESIDKNRYTTKINLDPGKSSSHSFKLDFTKPGPHFIRAEISSDFLETDDKRYLAVDVKQTMNILLVDGDYHKKWQKSETGPIRKMLDPREDQRHGFKCDTRVGVDMLTVDEITEGSFDCIVLANVNEIPEDKAQALYKYVYSGGGLFITLGDKIITESYNKDLYANGKGILPVQLTKTEGQVPFQRGNSIFRFNRMKSDHPVFKEFVDMPSNLLFDKRLMFYKFYTFNKDSIDPKTTSVLLNWDDFNNNPAMIEKKIGDGKSIIYSSTWDDEWNQGWPGHIPFGMLTFELVRYLAARPMKNINFTVGQTIEYTIPILNKATFLLTHEQHPLGSPDGGSKSVNPEPPKEGSQDIYMKLYYPPKSSTKKDDKNAISNSGIHKIGIWSLSYSKADIDKGKPPGPITFFAVNTASDPAAPEQSESNLIRISKEELRADLSGFEFEYVGEGAKDKDISSSSHIWKYVLYLLLGFLLVESLLAWLFGRGKE